MTSRTFSLEPSPLARHLTRATFGEHHSGVVATDIDSTWRALHEVRFGDLRLTRPFFLVRGFGTTAGLDRPVFELFSGHGLLAERPPRRDGDGPVVGDAVLAMVGRPWSPIPQSAHVADLQEFDAYDEPGWLKYGMDWVLTELPGGRTLVETTTLCEGTDASARRRFTPYWLLIRPFSGLIRRELIATLGRLASRRGRLAPCPSTPSSISL